MYRAVYGRAPDADEAKLANEFVVQNIADGDGSSVAESSPWKYGYGNYDEPNKRYKVRVRPLETEEPSMVFDISPTNFLVWTADGKNLLYRELEPSQASNSTVWMQPVLGGEPKPFLNVKPDTIFNVSQSNDGKQTLVVRGKLFTDAVMLTKITQTK